MRKVFSILGMVLCAAVVVVGVLSLNGSFPMVDTDAPWGDVTSSLYDHGYASFGGDYYTYSNNNMAIAAENTRFTAHNIAQMISNQNVYFGIIIIAIGVIGFCAFGVALDGNKKNIVVQANGHTSTITTDIKNTVPANTAAPSAGTSIHNAIPAGNYVSDWMKHQNGQKTAPLEGPDFAE